MDEQGILEGLLDLAREGGMEVRAAPMGGSEDHPGGDLIRLRGREILFLDTSASFADRIAVVAGALRGRDFVEDRFLPPELRDVLDAAK